MWYIYLNRIKNNLIIKYEEKKMATNISRDDGLGGPSHLFAQTDLETQQERFDRLMEEDFCIYCGVVGADHVCDKTLSKPGQGV
jgi:hypothetical protein